MDLERSATIISLEPERRRPGRPTLTNEQLLDKALDLFLEQGFERTSIDAITAAAGMAKRTVYARYGDKLSLFRAALHRAIEEWIVPVDRLRAAETEDLEQTLLAIGRILAANIMSPAGIRLLRITNAESVRMPEIGAYTYREGTERTIAYLADLFRRRVGPAPRPLDDWNEAATAFLYLVTGPGTMAAWGIRLDDEAIDNHTRYCVRLFLDGLLQREQGASVPGPDMIELQEENRRLREMLVEAMLQASALKTKLEASGPETR